MNWQILRVKFLLFGHKLQLTSDSYFVTVLNHWRRPGLTVYETVKLDTTATLLTSSDSPDIPCRGETCCICIICCPIPSVCLHSTMRWECFVTAESCCGDSLLRAIVISHSLQMLSKRNTVFYGGDSISMFDYMIWPWFERLEPFQLKEWVPRLASSAYWSASA